MSTEEAKWNESIRSLLLAFTSILHYLWCLFQLVFYYTKWRINRMSIEDDRRREVTLSELELMTEIGSELLKNSSKVRELFIESMGGLKDFAKEEESPEKVKRAETPAAESSE